MTVFKGGQILNAQSADITNSLPASTGGTEGQKAKNKEDTENQNVPEEGGSEPEPRSRPAARLKFNFGDQTRLLTSNKPSDWTESRRVQNRGSCCILLSPETGRRHTAETLDGLAQNI